VIELGQPAMRKTQWLFSILMIAGLTSCAIRPSFLQRTQYDKRLESLQKERAKLSRQTDPVDRTKTNIKIADMLLTLATDAVKTGEPEVLDKRMTEYVETIRDAHQTMMKTGRDAHRKPKGFKDLEIALRKHERILKEIAMSVTFDQRDPVEKAMQEAAQIREDVFRALFGENNAPRKG